MNRRPEKYQNDYSKDYNKEYCSYVVLNLFRLALAPSLPSCSSKITSSPFERRLSVLV
jgi:hypothetical protein